MDDSGTAILITARAVARRWWGTLQCNSTEQDMVGHIALRLCQAAKRKALTPQLRLHIARHAAIDFMRARRAAKHRSFRFVDRQLYVVDRHDDTPDEFEALLKPLSESDRAICRRVYVHDDTEREAARSLGIPRAKVRRAVQRALTIIRKVQCTRLAFSCYSAQTALKPATRQSMS